jgi:hypothetical protein
MRRGRNGNLYLSEDGEFLGINLGADYCAEHEWGLEGLATDFGLDKTAPPGVARHQIRRIPTERYRTFAYRPKEKYVGYVFPEGEISREVAQLYEDEEFAGAWSGSDFGIRFKDKKYAQLLAEAFLSLDIAFLFLKNENPFGRSGLCLMIVSKMDPAVLESFAAEEAEQDRLLKLVKESGIEDRLKKAGDKAAGNSRAYPRPFSYFALSPRWADDEHTKIKFWLNPCDQKNVNFGWFTVEDLDDWIAGKGKVVAPKASR